MIILKFGGTSVSTHERLETICTIVQEEKERQPVVVVSAIRGVTDLLLSLPSASVNERKSIFVQIRGLHGKLLDQYDSSLQDQVLPFLEQCEQEIQKILASKKKNSELSDAIVSYGEIMSSYLIATVMDHFGISAKAIKATELIVTDNEFGSAEFLPKETTAKTKAILDPLLKEGIVPVITGFIGSTSNGKVTTLGRGGSDYSAAIIGYALSAEEIQIWTDVDGIYSADPRFIKDAKLLPQVSYREAAELAAFGAKVLHPRTIRPAMQKNIPVRVCNTLNPTNEGTIITKDIAVEKRIAAIATKKHITLVTIYSTEMLFKKGFLAEVFALFTKHHISVDLVSVSEVSVSISLENDEHLSAAMADLKAIGTVTRSESCGMIALIGEGVGSVGHIMHTVFSTFESINIVTQMISQSTANINISLVIPSEQIDTAVVLLHARLINQKGAK